MLDLFEQTKNSLVNALRRGYTFDFGDDGQAQVTNPKGTVYNVDGVRCTCPSSAFSKGKPCKHAIMVSQVFPCPECGRKMLLTRVKFVGDTDTEKRYQFQCRNNHILSWQQVNERRRQ